MRRAARSFGIIDPALVLARLRRFGQPSAHDMPLEIVRNAVVFHARGLVNTRAIQNNLDWVWPYWIVRQFDPRDVSFLPRSANISHVNLTHRNWTAVGLPDLAVYPLVDPRGLVTPLHDGWSIDAWIIARTGESLFPSRLLSAQQQLNTDDQSISTRSETRSLQLVSSAAVEWDGASPILRLQYVAEAQVPAELVVSVRPYNPEGVQFIDKLSVLQQRDGWRVNEHDSIHFSAVPDRMVHSTYEEGDVVHSLKRDSQTGIECSVGMATGAACFGLEPHRSRTVQVSIPLQREARRQHGKQYRVTAWASSRLGLARLSVPDPRYQLIYESSLNTLLMLSAVEVYPGPFTYRRFWFRDASLMLETLAQIGAADRVKERLSRFPEQQRKDGYFESQEGEWDSNGQVLWVFGRYLKLTGEVLPREWRTSIIRAIDWLERHQLPLDNRPQAGLLPAGFSAEHFGPNDHYFWDVFWAIGGLRAIAPAFSGEPTPIADACNELAERYFGAVERSIDSFALARGRGAIPASPFRRMDSGAIGVLVADYPLQLYPPNEARLRRTIEFFLANNFVNGGFFQDMTHSGVNVYLTMAVAQSLLRAGAHGWQDIVRQVASDASSTGVWPEAIHPHTHGGCIGDGQHGWAAAEWLRWTRNAFVREEGDGLELCSGLLPEWLDARESMSFGPTLTPWGPVSVSIEPAADRCWDVQMTAHWRRDVPQVRVKLPGSRGRTLQGRTMRIELEEQFA